MQASLLLHQTLHYARESFAEGLSKLGYRTSFDYAPPSPGSVLVCWNRYSRDEHKIRAYEASGAQVLIAENAWIGPEEKDKHLFAICRSHHNGAGTWHVGQEDRWAKLGTELKPWRTNGDAILVLPQRGMGEEGIAQPKGWADRIEARLRRVTDRPIRFRKHPGIRPHPEIDFSGVHAVVTWASGAGIKAIVAGVPVFYELPDWIGAPAAKLGIEEIEQPFLGDRLPMLRRLAWAMWDAEEIAAGEPFRCLLKSE